MASYIGRNLVAFVALLIAILALGTTSAYAINAIRSSDIVDGQVQNRKSWTALRWVSSGTGRSPRRR